MIEENKEDVDEGKGRKKKRRGFGLLNHGKRLLQKAHTALVDHIDAGLDKELADQDHENNVRF